MENPLVSQSRLMFSQDPSESPIPKNMHAFRTPDLIPLKQRAINAKLASGGIVEISDSGFEMMAP